jgi:N-acetylmuramoyl-L-alanine amidase
VGWRLHLPKKSPLALPALGAQQSLYPLKEAAVYSGITVTWRSSARILQLQGRSRTARLVLDEAYLYDGSQRVALPQPLTLAAGTPALDEAGLRLVLQHLADPMPVFENASEDELAAARQALAPETPAAIPTLQPTQEPELVPTPANHAAARILNGAAQTIYIDAGHGGEDPGAHGPKGLREKDVCLDIARRVKAELLRRHQDLNVVLTRPTDDFVSLRGRTDLANKGEADLFVSIHNNAARNRESRGTQVFFYDSQTSDRAAADLVMREEPDANQLDILLTDIAKSLVRDQSINLADKVQDELYKALNLKHRGLSYAPFYVLARTKMPAILVEVAFITNPKEEALLADPDFRQKVAASIARGVLRYSDANQARGQH